MDAIVAAGYPYEFAGLLYYVFFLVMGRPRFAGLYSLRTRVITLLAAIAMVACVPLHYATSVIGVVGMLALGVVALGSATLDAVKAKR